VHAGKKVEPPFRIIVGMLTPKAATLRFGRGTTQALQGVDVVGEPALPLDRFEVAEPVGRHASDRFIGSNRSCR
jgi:hypothetical protein